MSPGHALLIPKGQYTTTMEMPPDVAANVLKELPRLANAVMAATGADGVNIFNNNGSASGQVVMHVHYHVLPRFTEDGLIKLSAPRKEMLSEDEGKEWLNKIKTNL
eukprot:Filipodium_phascolosomae@DN3603_c0_g1_i2.p1